MSEEAVPTTSRRREATRQRLLDAAAQVFAEVGLEAASVEAVCERAGYTRGAFYSNFDTKEELFLELCARTASTQIAAVRGVVADITAGGAGEPGLLADGPVALVQRVLGAAADDRMSVLLLSEVRIRALRNPSVASAYRRQGAEMRAEVAQILSDLARARGFVMRVPEDAAAELFITVWTAAAEEAAMDELGSDGVRRRIGERLQVVAETVIDRW